MNETEVGARIDDVVLAPRNMRGTYYAPYPYDSYPYDGPSGYPADYLDPDSGNNDPPPADPSARPQANQDGPARAWRPEGAANTTHRNSNVAAIAPRAPVRSVDRITVTSNSYGVGHFHDGEGSSPSEPARNRMRRFGRKCRKRCKDCARCRRLRASAKSRPVATVSFLPRRSRF